MTNNPESVGVSLAKTILSGEHSAVYGYPALVASVDKRLRVKLTKSNTNEAQTDPIIRNAIELFTKTYQLPETAFSIKIDSEIPIQSGLGSSAALAFALFQALFHYHEKTFTKEEILALVRQNDQFAHGRASGVDTAAIVEGGLIRFQNKNEIVTTEHLATDFLSEQIFFLIQSGKPVETTKEMVAIVKNNIEDNADLKETLAQIGQATLAIIESLQQQEINEKMFRLNQVLLDKLGVVGNHARMMINVIQDKGGVAKITGAGGREAGSGMLLAYHEEPKVLENLIATQQWQGFSIHLAKG